MHLHILGICGTFMAGIAAIAKEAGHRVTGCDAAAWPPMDAQLRALGIKVTLGYDAQQLEFKPDLFLIGNVVSRGNALMEAILNAGAPYQSAPQWLYEQVLCRRSVYAVAGTHGKTSVTSMLAWIFADAGLQPGFLIGGVANNFPASASLGGSGAPFVIEADEYDTAFFDKRSKFVHYHPVRAVLNNLEFDHGDIFSSLSEIERQFHHLVRTIPGKGCVIVNQQSEALQRVLARGLWSERLDFNTQTPGAKGFAARRDAAGLHILQDGQEVGVIRAWPEGEHNAMNAQAAIAAAMDRVAPARACAALERFTGVKRRLELRGEVRCSNAEPIRVYDDFAHHPTAIALTIDALRATHTTPRRILAVFEPRSNTLRQGLLREQLPAALGHAEVVFINTQSLGWDAAAAFAPLGDRATLAEGVEKLAAAIATVARAGDDVLVMSNGAFGGIHEILLKLLSAASH